MDLLCSISAALVSGLRNRHTCRKGRRVLSLTPGCYFLHTVITKSENKKGKRQKKPLAYKNFPLAKRPPAEQFSQNIHSKLLSV